MKLAYHLIAFHTGIGLVLDRLGSVYAIVTNRTTNSILSPLIEGGLEPGSLRFRRPCRVEFVIDKGSTFTLLDSKSNQTDVRVQFTPFAWAVLVGIGVVTLDVR